MLPSLLATASQWLPGQFGPFARHDNPSLYPIVLAALLLSVLLGVVNFIVIRSRSKNRATSNILANELVVLILELVAIYLIWLAYATPFARLPFASPDPNARWIGVLPGAQTYLALAVTLHGLMSLAGALVLAVTWLIQFNVAATDSGLTTFAYLIMLGAVVLAVFGWENQAWPVGFLVIAEALLNASLVREFVRGGISALAVRVGAAVLRPLHQPDPVSIDQFQQGVTVLIMLAAVVAIWLAHPLDLYVADLFGIYYALTLLDYLIACFLAPFRRSYFTNDRYSLLSTTDRWRVTLPLVLILSTVAASGVLAPISANPGLTYGVWVEAGAAAAAYMLFRPLTDQARTLIIQGARARAGGHADPTPTVVHPALMPKPETPAEEALDNVKRALQFSRGLNFPAFIVFLVSALIYHLLITTLGLSTTLDNDTFPLVSGIVAFITGALPLLINASTDMLRPSILISVRLLLMTTVVTAITFVLVFLPAASGTLSLDGGTPAMLLGDPHFLLVTAHRLAQEFLLLLVAGQFLYLWRIVGSATSSSVS